MRIKNAKLEWYAFRYDNNLSGLVFINVLSGMETEIARKIKKGVKDNWKPVTDYKSFKDWLKGDFMYRFWSKAEHEVVIYDLFDTNDERGEKHDIWWQLEPNLDRICEYIINTMEIKFDENKRVSKQTCNK